MSEMHEYRNNRGGVHTAAGNKNYLDPNRRVRLQNDPESDNESELTHHQYDVSDD